MRPAHSDFDRWDASQYLQQYYTRVEADEAVTLAFITQACRRIGASGRALVFGAGPTVHHLLPLVPHVREVHVADYLPSNLEQVRRWLRRDPCSHDWQAFVRHVLACEGVRAPTTRQVNVRERLVRARVTHCLPGDAALTSPLAGCGHGRYDVVLSCYCAESATGDKAVWRRYVHNIASLVAPGGLFITAALRHCKAYQVGPHRFACVDIDEHDLVSALMSAGLQAAPIQLEVHLVGLHERHGYDSIVLAAAQAQKGSEPPPGLDLAARVGLASPGGATGRTRGHTR
jgi:hypothetical protein